ncbi:MAG: LuxR C-terminal-related transcriptional regulator [Pirellulales bacterium]|nr:LuxR C-terminal-related transcriptional regulator [Pirellulales bacterium]
MSQATDQPGTLLGKPLTNREGQVFMLVGKGLTNSEIAGRLKLSVHTVRAHRKRIAGKLGVDGGEAARRAILMDRGRRGPS